MRRGEIWWASVAKPNGSEPGYRRPVLIVQVNAFNRSKIPTVLVATLTSNLDLAEDRLHRAIGDVHDGGPILPGDGADVPLEIDKQFAASRP